MRWIDELHMEFTFRGSRKALVWRLSVTLEAGTCLEALEKPSPATARRRS